MTGSQRQARALRRIRRLRSGPRRAHPPLAAPAPPGKADERLDALAAMMLREGFRHLTVGEIARRLRCSRRSLYELAPSKHALFTVVLERLLCRIEHAGRAGAAATEPFEVRIRAFLEPGIVQLRDASAAFFADIASVPATRRCLEQHQAARGRQLEELLGLGVRAGAFRSIHPAVAVTAMLSAYRAVTNPDFLIATDVSLVEAVREAEDLLLKGLLHPET